MCVCVCVCVCVYVYVCGEGGDLKESTRNTVQSVFCFLKKNEEKVCKYYPRHAGSAYWNDSSTSTVQIASC